MELVIDANILFSALIKEGTTRELLLNSRLRLYAPEFLIEEFTKYVSLLSKKTRVPEKKLKDLLKEMFEEANVKVIATPELSEFMPKATEISPDPNDAIYFALALKLSCPIWSNDKRLKQQRSIKIYSTKDLIEMFG